MASTVVSVVDLVAEPAHCSRQGIAIDLREIRTPLVDLGGLERLPAAFGAVVREIACDGVCVELRVELATGVVLVDREDQVAGETVFIGALRADPRGSPGFEFVQRVVDRSLVRVPAEWER